ncbi:MAG: hypothetical protein ACR2NR_03015 [Solirubrobacteraceae bacterium]
MSSRRRRLAAVTAALALSSSPGVGALVAINQPSPAAARLQGFYAMSGEVIDAVNVGGEYRGEVVQRQWAFSSVCPAGACPTVTLIRRRATGVSDTLILYRRAPAFYVGTGMFYAPVQCGRRRILRGTRVPFQITVRITAATTALNGQVLATQLRAFYRNPSRTVLTSCVSLPAHDAVRYTGVPALPSAGSQRSVANTAPTVTS